MVHRGACQVWTEAPIVQRLGYIRRPPAPCVEPLCLFCSLCLRLSFRGRRRSSSPISVACCTVDACRHGRRALEHACSEAQQIPRSLSGGDGIVPDGTVARRHAGSRARLACHSSNQKSLRFQLREAGIRKCFSSIPTMASCICSFIPLNLVCTIFCDSTSDERSLKGLSRSFAALSSLEFGWGAIQALRGAGVSISQSGRVS